MDFKKLQDQLLKHEGIRFSPYVDTVGKLTIGVGHNLTDKGLTKSQIMSILMDDMTDAVNFLNFEFDWFKSLDEPRQRALADLSFNMGRKLLQFHNMLDALAHSDWTRAADELLNSTYAKQVGRRARDIAYMIRTGQDPI